MPERVMLCRPILVLQVADGLGFLESPNFEAEVIGPGTETHHFILGYPAPCYRKSADLGLITAMMKREAEDGWHRMAGKP